MAKLKVLLSGGIGSGKSSVGELLAARGALVIDADRVGHEVLDPGGPAHDAVAARWPGVVGAGGCIDRRRLGELVFADPGQLAELEAITHPAIRRRIAELVDAATEPVVVVEVPLRRNFLGDGWLRVVVVAPAAVRAERLAARGMSEPDIALRMAAQPSDAEWRSWAGRVVDNGGDRQALEAEVGALWEDLTAARRPSAPGRSGPRMRPVVE